MNKNKGIFKLSLTNTRTVKKLHYRWKQYFTEKDYIKMTSGTHTKDGIETPCVEVIVTTEKEGQGKEYWSAYYAEEMIRKPKELDLAAQRWISSFKNNKKIGA